MCRFFSVMCRFEIDRREQGYSAGAIYASTIRPPKDIAPTDMFKPAKYILVSYPVLPAPFLG